MIDIMRSKLDSKVSNEGKFKLEAEGKSNEQRVAKRRTTDQDLANCQKCTIILNYVEIAFPNIPLHFLDPRSKLIACLLK